MTGVRNQDGFTLVEMLVVLTIIALAAAVSFPFVGGSSGARQLAALSHKIASALRMTRDAAAASNQEQQLVIDLEHRIVTWPGHSNIDLPGDMKVTITSAAGDVSEATATFRFFPDGGSTGGNIVLSMGETSRAIAVSWLTGAVAIEDVDAR